MGFYLHYVFYFPKRNESLKAIRILFVPISLFLESDGFYLR